MIKKIGAITGLLAVIISSVLSFSAVALATNGEGFTIVSANPNTINPRRFIFELKPGDSVDDFVEVQNLSSEPKNFLLYGADPTFSAQGTPAYKTRQAGGNGEGRWITFEEPEITLAANEKRILRFTVKVPETIAKGDYRAGIAMEKAAEQSQNQPGISIATRIILHTEIKVTDNPKAVPHVDGTVSIGETVTTPEAAQKADWRTFYFWISFALFIFSAIALIWVTLSGCMQSHPVKEDVKHAAASTKPSSRTGTTHSKKHPRKSAKSLRKKH